MDWFVEHWQETLLALFGGVGVVIIGAIIRKKSKDNGQTIGKKIKADGDVTIEKAKQTSVGKNHTDQTIGEDIEGKNVTIKDTEQDSKS